MIVNYRVRLFAGAAQVAGAAIIDLTWTSGASVQAVSSIADRLAAERPALADWILRSRWAWNDEFVTLDTLIPTTHEIALIPPVSGG